MKFATHRPLPAALIILSTFVLSTGCPATGDSENNGKSGNQFHQARKEMVARQIRGRDINDKRVLDAMAKVERHHFVPREIIDLAYADRPLPIGEDQTISQPYIVALMTQLLKVDSADIILEIGTGSGYQAAILAELAAEVYSIEIIESLALRAESLLNRLGYENVHVRAGDGYQGWPAKAPFDGIIVTCAPDNIPKPLVDQLAEGGRMVIPVGDSNYQELVLLKKTDGKILKEEIVPVRFVPMTGQIQKLQETLFTE